jgi:hypothetical protein
VASTIIPGSIDSGYTAAWSMFKDTGPQLAVEIGRTITTGKNFDYKTGLKPVIDYFDKGSMMEIESSLNLSSFPDGGTVSYASGTKEAKVSTYITMILKGLIIAASEVTYSDAVLKQTFKDVYKAAITDAELMNKIYNRIETGVLNKDESTIKLISSDLSSWLKDKGAQKIFNSLYSQGIASIGLSNIVDKLTSINDVAEKVSNGLILLSYKRDIAIASTFGSKVLWYDMSYDESGYLKPIYKMNWLNAPSPINQHDEVIFQATKNTYDDSTTWWNPFSWNDTFQAEYERYSYRPVSKIGKTTDIETLIDRVKETHETPQPTLDENGDLTKSQAYVELSSTTTTQPNYDEKTNKFTAKAGDKITMSFRNFQECTEPFASKASGVKVQFNYTNDVGVVGTLSDDKSELTLTVPNDGSFSISNFGYLDSTRNNRLTTCGKVDSILHLSSSAASGGGNSGDTTASMPVLHTGQTISYTNYDDAYYHAGKARSYTRDDTKEIVTDNVTKLMWQDNSDAKTIKKTWQDAQDYCDALSLGGYSDWRLPEVKELLSIADSGKYSPALSATFVNFTQDNYWSSTTNAYYSDHAWIVSSYDGYTGYNFKSDEYYVRCVRGNQ